jgi:CRISPR-associated protein Csh1
VLKDCLEVFERQMEKVRIKGRGEDSLILDSYIPADGCYILVNSKGEIICQVDLKFNKKTKQMEGISERHYDKLCFFDYHSRLVSMDKPVDSKKVIHSNNYLSFWVKQENLSNGKLNEEAIDRYFDVLSNPEKKYSKSKDRQMYEYIADQLVEINEEKLERCRNWIKKYIFNLEELGISLSGKNYLKIFFEEDRECYLQEEQRYLITKIFNKNDYNQEIDKKIWGLPNDNLGMNQKKPYMAHKTRKVELPYMVTAQEAVLQKKFFDYLYNQAAAGKVNIYIDPEKGEIRAFSKEERMQKDFTGYYLYIQKGTEAQIMHQDVIVDYRYHLRKRFHYINVFYRETEDEIYKDYGTMEQVENLLNEILFSKWLVSNYFTPVDELQISGEIARNLICSRDGIFAWLYKNETQNICTVLSKVSMNLIKDSIRNGYISKAVKQFNLKCSLEEYFSGGEKMSTDYEAIQKKLRRKILSKETEVIVSDEEYYYAVGQLVNYFISLSKTKDKKHSLANPFFNIKNDQVLKEKLRQYFMKYNYQLDCAETRFNNLYAMICNYTNAEKIDQNSMIAGYINNNILQKKDQEERVNE